MPSSDSLSFRSSSHFSSAMYAVFLNCPSPTASSLRLCWALSCCGPHSAYNCSLWFFSPLAGSAPRGTCPHISASPAPAAGRRHAVSAWGRGEGLPHTRCLGWTHIHQSPWSSQCPTRQETEAGVGAVTRPGHWVAELEVNPGILISDIMPFARLNAVSHMFT